MSTPGFLGGGGASEFSAGRSITAAANTMNNLTTTTPSIVNNHLHHPSLYRTQHQHQQLPPIFLDPSSQIPQRQTPTFTGKRTLAEFQTQQNPNYNININNQNHNNLNLNHNHNHLLSTLLLRSVKPRTTFYHTSSPSPLSPMDFSSVPELQQNPLGFQTQRLGVPLLHQLRPQPINTGSLPLPLPIPMTNSILSNHNFRNSNLGQVQDRAEPEKKIMDHRLLELEKQLLEDNDEGEEADAASVITTSEWSETYQNLIGPGPAQAQTQKPASSSPTSSTTSSTCSSSAASPASGCSKQTLMEAASAIAEGKNDVASEILARLAQGPNPTGNSDQRLTDCMVSALKSRMNPVENPPPVAELFSREHAESTQLLLENSVCFKVGYMAANLAILEAAFEEENNNGNAFCVVDFDIGQGKQHVNLLHALSARVQNGKVKIVAVAENGSEERLRAVGEMLSRQAERLRIGFEFRVVSANQKLAELTRESLGLDPEETLVVNLPFKLNRIPDESVSTENPRDELLRRVKKLAPRVVTVVEQEMNGNTAPFLARVAESWSYYSALFDSVESVLGRDNPDRVRVEEGLSRKLCNSVACEGRDRVERCEVFGKWRARMNMASFQLKPLSQNLAESIKSRLAVGNNRVNSGLTVKEENGVICFGWMGRKLTVTSAWR